MAIPRKSSLLDRRLKEIEREKERLRAQMAEVRHWADSVPDAEAMLREPRWREDAPAGAHRSEGGGVGVVEREADGTPEDALSLDFAPGPDGLDTKRVVMPQLQRTDLLRPAIGGHAPAGKLMEPPHDRFRNYFGTTGLKRVREARREQGNHRVRAIFMILMVLTLSFILFKMVT